MKIAGIIFAIIGAALLCLGGYLFVREQLFTQKAGQSTATVTDNKRYTYIHEDPMNDSTQNYYYCSEFQFQTKDGQSISIKETGTDCSKPDAAPDYQIGQKVAVYYDPENPANALQIARFVDQYFVAIKLMSAIGILLVLFGLGLLRAGSIRSKRTSSPEASQ